MDPQLRAAVLGASNIQAPAPIDPAFTSPEIAQANQIKFQLPQSNAGAYAIGQQADMDLKAQEQAAAYEEKRKAALLDPSKYQQIPKEDGGYSFLDPLGNEISAHDYSRVTGKSVASILSDSENPIDIGFLQDFSNLQDYIDAKIASKTDPEADGLVKQIEQTVRDEFGEDLSQMEIKQVIERFQRAYPTVYGLKQPGVQAGRTFLPSTSAAEAGADTTIVGG